MKVKIGDLIYDSQYEPVMVILDSEDKENIKCMDVTATMYAAFPEDWGSADDKLKWMHAQ